MHIDIGQGPEAGMAQWWEMFPPTNVAWVLFRPGVRCGLSLLIPCSEGFSPGSQVFLPLQIPRFGSVVRLLKVSSLLIKLTVDLFVYLFLFLYEEAWYILTLRKS